MSEQTVQQRPQKAASIPQPFVVEVKSKHSAAYGSQILNESFRGYWSRHRLGKMTAAISVKMSMMPDIPGIHLHVSPKDNTVTIRDPLEKDPKLLKEISRVARGAMIGFQGEYEAIPERIKTLNDDEMVSLLIEMRHCVDKTDPLLEVKSGQLPTMAQIESMPGRELNDPRSPFKNKAKYKGDKDRHQILLEAMKEKGILM